MDPYFDIQRLKKKIKKYEDGLIKIACFNEGINFSGMDEPGSAELARELLGKKICKKYLKE